MRTRGSVSFIRTVQLQPPKSASSFHSSGRSHPHHKLSEADPSLKSSGSSLLIGPIVNAPHSRDCPSSYSLKIRKGGLAATFSPDTPNLKPYSTLCLTPGISTSSLLIHQVSYQEVRIKNKQISFMSAETSGQLGCRVSCSNSL